MRGFALTLTALALLACGGDNLTGPGSDLVGSWQLVSTNIGATAAANLREHLLDNGVNPDVVDEQVEEIRSAMDLVFRDVGLSILRVHADGTYADNYGDRGTWSVKGDTLTITDRDAITITCRYFVDGQDLTLIFNKAQLRVTMMPHGHEARQFFDIMFRADDVLRLFFKTRP
ncbi:MAG: lipocalin family protein [Gemmatimonadota bacterium]|nr:lipocalin family protein [Gemmatimonadota bacterium]